MTPFPAPAMSEEAAAARCARLPGIPRGVADDAAHGMHPRGGV